MLFIVVTLLSLLRVIPLSALEIAAYTCLFWGISFFYSSYLKQYKTGIVIGSISFLTGSILFVFTRFEILSFGTVFIPSALIIIGLSLLISNLLTETNSTSVIFSILSMFAGIWLTISRGTATVELYLTAVYDLLRSYWIIVLILAAIIFLTGRNFTKRKNDQN
jgi:hypothetical protein